jgi:uncharacterized protein (TIGR03083 family)
MLMDRDAFLDVLQHESTALLATARAADPTAPVPGCPDWTTTDLVWHIGEVHDFWGYIVRERSTAPDDYADPARPGNGASTAEAFESVHTFASERAAELHRVLSEADPSTPVWTWTPQKDIAFVLRRMAHETAVHRVDAEHAAGRDHRLDTDLAVDGVDEFLAYFLPIARVESAPLGGSVHLHCTDQGVAAGDGEWTIRTGDDGAYVVTRDHTKADTALRGDAHDLLMALWRRAPLDAIAVFGDRELAEAFIAKASNE